jgi:hypothetical protein
MANPRVTAVVASAASFYQGNNAVAVGYAAGGSAQGANSVAIGSNTKASTSSVAIGYLAGNGASAVNSIILNAGTTALNSANSGLFVKPVRSASSVPVGFFQMYYNPTSGEIVVVV